MTNSTIRRWLSALAVTVAACSSGSVDGDAPAAPDASDATSGDATDAPEEPGDTADAADASDASTTLDAGLQPKPDAACSDGEQRSCIGHNGCAMTETCESGQWPGCFCVPCSLDDAMTSCTWSGQDPYSLGSVAFLELVHADGTTEKIERVGPGACEPGVLGYRRDSVSDPTEIRLCPGTCDTFEAEPAAELVVHFGCPVP